jgi:hypothetical protein
MIESRHDDGAIQMLALGPKLKLARFVAGVLADFERGDDDHFWADQLGRPGQ